MALPWPPRRWLAAAALALAACASPEERFATHMERGEGHLEEGRVKDAILEFQSALNFQPQSPDAYERIADALIAHGRFSEALPYFQQAYRLDDSRLRSAMYEARLVAGRDRARARELLSIGLQQAPELAIVQRTAAHLAVLDGDTARALAAAKRAIALDEGDAASWSELARVHEARLHERRLRGLPDDPEIFEETVAALDRVDALEGGFARARLEKARILAHWPERRSEARAVYEDALELAREEGSPSDIRLAAQAIDNYAGLTRDNRLRRLAWRAAVEAREDDYEAWDVLGRVMGRRGEEIYLELLDRRPDDPRSHLHYARYLLRAGRGRDAEAHLARAIADGGNDPRLWEQSLRIAITAGDLVGAREVYAEMAERHPDSWATSLAEARVTLFEGRTAEAIQQLHRLIARDELNFEFHRLLALGELRSGNLAEARSAIAEAERLGPQPHYPTLRIKARIAAELGEWRDVVQAYQVIAGRGQDLSVEERVRLVRALARVGSRERSRQILGELLEAPPIRPEVALVYAELESRREPERAYELLIAALEQAPGHSELLEEITRRDLAEGRHAEALARVSAVVASAAVTPRTLLLRAQLLALAGSAEQAEADALRAFEANPMLPGAIELLFEIYRAQDRLAEARRSFEQAEQAGVLHPGARLLLARLYLVEGDLVRARATLERVLEEGPELWPAKRDLALVLAEQGEDLDRALVLVREALRNAATDPAVVDAVGYVNLKASRLEAARQQFDRAIRLAQQRGEVQPRLRYHLGLALLALGRAEEAAEAFETALGQGDFPEAEEARRQLEAARHPEDRPESAS